MQKFVGSLSSYCGLRKNYASQHLVCSAYLSTVATAYCFVVGCFGVYILVCSFCTVHNPHFLRRSKASFCGGGQATVRVASEIGEGSL